jgi:hypothetical protein
VSDVPDEMTMLRVTTTSKTKSATTAARAGR